MTGTHTRDTSRLKRAETTASIGAGSLGAGIALFLSRFLSPFATPILVLGLVMHAWGMFDKHRLEGSAEVERVRWAEALYWLCWGSLIVLIIALFIRRS